MGDAQERMGKPYGSAIDHFVREERKLRILIVDDEPSVRRTVRRMLGKDYFAFTEAADLEEARQAMACRQPPDIVVLDLALKSGRPEEGVEFLREVTAQVAFTPVVVLTGRADVKIAVRAMHLGAVDVLQKGDDNENIRNALRRGLELAIAKRTVRPRETDDTENQDGRASASRLKSLDFYVQETKKQVVSEAIARAGGNLTDAARALGVKRANLHRLAVKLGVHEPADSRRKGEK